MKEHIFKENQGFLKSKKENSLIRTSSSINGLKNIGCRSFTSHRIKGYNREIAL